MQNNKISKIYKKTIINKKTNIRISNSLKKYNLEKLYNDIGIYTYEKISSIIFPLITHSSNDISALNILNIDKDDNIKMSYCKGKANGKFYNLTPNNTTENIIIGEGFLSVASVHQSINVEMRKQFSFLAYSNPIFLTKYIPNDNTKIIFILVKSDSKKPFTGQNKSTEFANLMLQRGIKIRLITPDDTCFSENPLKLNFIDLRLKDSTGKSILKRLNTKVPF